MYLYTIGKSKFNLLFFKKYKYSIFLYSPPIKLYISPQFTGFSAEISFNPVISFLYSLGKLVESVMNPVMSLGLAGVPIRQAYSCPEPVDSTCTFEPRKMTEESRVFLKFQW